MPVTNYYSVEGEILGEKTTGGSRVDYLTDALGSVTATVDQTAQVVNTYRYKPYGKQLAKTGGGSDPKFQWVGSVGYWQTGRTYSDVYVRARHYDTSTGRWTTKDPINSHIRRRGRRTIETNSYFYANASPTNYIDPSGKVAISGCSGQPLQAIVQAVSQLCSFINNMSFSDMSEFTSCMKQLDPIGSFPGVGPFENVLPSPYCPNGCVINCFKHFCQGYGRGQTGLFEPPFEQAGLFVPGGPGQIYCNTTTTTGDCALSNGYGSCRRPQGMRMILYVNKIFKPLKPDDIDFGQGQLSGQIAEECRCATGRNLSYPPCLDICKGHDLAFIIAHELSHICNPGSYVRDPNIYKNPADPNKPFRRPSEANAQHISCCLFKTFRKIK